MKDRFEGWLKNIHNSQENEISCSVCFDLVSSFVEMELSGEDAAGKLPQVAQHLHQCAACREEYETLRDLEQLDDNDQTPSLDDLRGLIH